MRYKITNGMFFEDFVVDNIHIHSYGRTIIDADNVWFSNLTMNVQQLHCNYDYAETEEHGVPLVNSCLTLSIVTGLSVFDFGRHLIANLGWDNVKLPNPVFIGDTLTASSKIIEARESKSNKDAGIITVHTKGLKQDCNPVIEFDRTFMVKKR